MLSCTYHLHHQIAYQLGGSHFSTKIGSWRLRLRSYRWMAYSTQPFPNRAFYSTSLCLDTGSGKIRYQTGDDIIVPAWIVAYVNTSITLMIDMTRSCLGRTDESQSGCDISMRELTLQVTFQSDTILYQQYERIIFSNGEELSWADDC